MNRVRRLLVFLSVFVCWPALAGAAEPSSLHVQIGLFSGRPNPTFVIGDPVAIRQFNNVFAALPPHPALPGKSPGVPLLGYSGSHVTPAGMDGVAWFDVFGNTVEVASPANAAGPQARTFRFR